ncbi:peptidylprolyl isomerase [archaeon]|jgi:cyclophilin family peptidyl-prolyl cis-trans isomerase|nr:peptidylprolyl isomerase [Candidatus Woesearchaeota archaeon]MBT3463368.1 peptidylprolyl isomerase [archaeon]MBT4352039.1 peptidylprolyl isomerase [archaeon]MBT4648023.1 peptidylprolyl isomerase [archaeon]MBT7392362.1 peptidylprolyl isomerase [archaeon]
MKRIITIILLSMIVISCGGKNMGTKIKIETSLGDMTVLLYDEKSPITTNNFKTLVEKGFYDGIIFHRIIPDFMIQGGDPTGTGMGGPGYQIEDEFHPELKHTKKGMLSMANSGPNTGGSQFFITLAPTPWLDGKHALFGEVVEGLDVLDKIGAVQTGAQDKPLDDVVMKKVSVVS